MTAHISKINLREINSEDGLKKNTCLKCDRVLAAPYDDMRAFMCVFHCDKHDKNGFFQ